MIRSVALACATVLGVGYAPVAPGTFGSAAGLLLWWLLPQSPGAQAAAIAGVFALGAWCGTVAERDSGRIDPGHVVIDEVLGMLVTLFMNPAGWVGGGAAFVAFRLFDIAKPYPADRMERLHGGVGIMADDAMAGVYANLALRAALAISGYPG
ncbi:MAG: phosphatidylglycerophosphatase A [Acidobacteria bacterium]|nr:phosphatidylglycerophosphatase A [Acidobacteriota bacterium]